MTRTRKHAPALALAAALLTAWAAPAWGAIDGSPHDLTAQGYVQVEEGASHPSRCVWCHLPAVGGDILPFDPPPASLSYYARSGLLCWSCHDGTTIVSPDVDASLSAFHPDSHPLELGSMTARDVENDVVTLPLRGNRLECITCHSPHDNAIRPFQRAVIDTLCLVCHQEYKNGGYGAGNLGGNHPVHETMEDDAGNASPIAARSEFTVPFPSPYPILGGRDATRVHWKRGGHLLFGAEGTLECFTCHAVHGGEAAPPRDLLLAVDRVMETSDEFCEGCHRGQRGDGQASAPFPNPGGTTTARTYHPCDNDVGNGPDSKPRTRARILWPLGASEKKPILCGTCHVAHNGMPGSAALRRPTQSQSFCEECHLPEEMPFHHPSGTSLTGERLCAPAPGELSLGGSLSAGVQCYSCHLAHNAGMGLKEEDYIPILRNSSREDETCTACHSENNVTCLEKEKGTASHFLGDPTLSETYSDSAPPERTESWPETGLFSKYGGENDQKVICLSCHSFERPTTDLKEPLPGHIVARSGNDVEWEDDQTVYLCTGCHGTNPGGDKMAETSHTHPLMDADASTLSIGVQPPSSATPSGAVNCDSCHRPHGALVQGGYYILEAVNGTSEDPKTVHPTIDFTVLCHLCHENY